jgi:pimeloyl-ACP methyl ester carboxylesterase
MCGVTDTASASLTALGTCLRVVIPGCGHIPHLEHPSRFLAELLPFLAS